MLTIRLALAAAAAAATGCAELTAPTLGDRELAIVGGVATDDYPAVPLLYYEHQDGAWATCSGTLISPHVVVTAGHCTNEPGTPALHVAYFGSTTLTERFEDDPAFLAAIDVVDRTYHADYVESEPTAGNDIGLVTLAEPAPVAPLPYHRERGGVLEPGSRLHVVGWGVTRAMGGDSGVKREVDAELVDSDDRFVRYGSAAGSTCQGDSGGPGFMTLDGQARLVSVTSFGDEPCLDSYGSRIDAYLELVETYVAEQDPTGGCLPDGACNGLCGEVDADCAAAAPAGDGGQADVASPAVGGCGAGGRTPTLGLTLALAALAARRRRAP